MEVKTIENDSRISIEVTEILNVKECYFPIVWGKMSKFPKFPSELGQVVFNEKDNVITAYREYYSSQNYQGSKSKDDKKFIKEAKQFIGKWAMEVRKTVKFIAMIRQIFNKDIDEKVRQALEAMHDLVEERLEDYEKKK